MGLIGIRACRLEMEEPYLNCLQCKHLLNTIDYMKYTLRILEQRLEKTQERLDIFILNGIMTEVIRHQVRLIKFERVTIDRLLTDLASKYTSCGDHLVNDHDEEDNED